MSKIINEREVHYDVAPIFPQRWSPKAMSGELLSEEQLMTLFEAAKWAPSSFNNQPWRFIYAKRNTEEWEDFFDLLNENNKVWAKNAAILVIIVSKTTFDHNEQFSRTHSFDTGAAWENLALQGTKMDLVVHAMQGFNYKHARKLLTLPEKYEVEAMVAIGKPGKNENLPTALQNGEKPSGRKDLSEIVSEGKFKWR